MPSAARIPISRIVLTAAVSLLLLPAFASADAGLKPSQAPLVAVGQHYFGNTEHLDNEDADLWRLPPLLTTDRVTIAWNYTGHYGADPRLCLAHDIDDYNWAENGKVCNGSSSYRVASNGSARSFIQVRRTTTAPYLEFWGYGDDSSQAYDFVVESIQHAIGVSLKRVLRIKPTATLTGSATLSDGSPVPDGTVFTLTTRWSNTASGATYHRRYVADSSGGQLTFHLKLPPSATGEKVSLIVSRSADAQYLRVKSNSLRVRVRLGHTHHRSRHNRQSLAKQCATSIFKTGEILSGTMLEPGKLHQLIAITLKFGQVDPQCNGRFKRLVSVRPQLQDVNNRRRWINEDLWSPLYASNEAGTPGETILNSHSIPRLYYPKHGHPRVRFQEKIKEQSVATHKTVKTKVVARPVRVKRG